MKYSNDGKVWMESRKRCVIAVFLPQSLVTHFVWHSEFTPSKREATCLLTTPAVAISRAVMAGRILLKRTTRATKTGAPGVLMDDPATTIGRAKALAG